MSEVVKDEMKVRDTLCHLAALIAILYSYDSPANYADTNINGTLKSFKLQELSFLQSLLNLRTIKKY